MSEKERIGNWEVQDDGSYTIKLDEEDAYYSSENQDTIIILEKLLQIKEKFDKAFPE